MDICHETLVFEREIAVPPARVFEAYVNTDVREKWSAPSPTAEVRIDTSNVSTGGRETGRCGSKGDLRWSLNLHYHRVTPDRQITFSEELWDGEEMLVVALITFDIQQASNGGTLLKLTDQITSFVGADVVAGHRQGYEQALTNLTHHLTS
ncbi:MAG: SRPBCC domain-containing protein [Pseudomonadota bacterium]